MRTRDKLPIGTISEATLRPEDLTPALLDALDPLHLTRAERRTIIEVRRNTRIPGYWEDERSNWDYDALVEIADAHVPAYCYFGSLEGDGACFGVWIDWESLEHGIDERDVSEGYSTYARFAKIVNDHGNVTLMRRAGRGRWVEEWSVV